MAKRTFDNIWNNFKEAARDTLGGIALFACLATVLPNNRPSVPASTELDHVMTGAAIGLGYTAVKRFVSASSFGKEPLKKRVGRTIFGFYGDEVILCQGFGHAADTMVRSIALKWRASQLKEPGGTITASNLAKAIRETGMEARPHWSKTPKDRFSL